MWWKAFKCALVRLLLSPTWLSTATDLDECEAKEADCVPPALCSNTYGGYRCVCNGTTDVDETQSCILGEGLGVTSLYIHRIGNKGLLCLSIRWPFCGSFGI